MPEFVRIQVNYSSAVTGKPCGVFGAVHHLKQRCLLSDAETTTLTAAEAWFEQNLPNPPLYDEGNPDRAITWFKSEAERFIQRLEPLVQILQAHGVDVEVARSSNPGRIVYEDTFQVAAV